MNTQVKVGIAAAIVAALVALIVLDQRTTPKDDSPRPTGGGETTIVGTNAGAEPSAQRLPDQEINRILQSAQQQFGDQTPKAAPSPVKGSEEPKEKRVTSTSTGEEYVIKEGDTLESIAQKHKSTAAKIAEANPGLKPTALRPGKKILIPAKGEKPVVDKQEEPVAATPSPAPSPVSADPKPAPPKQDFAGVKTYTVQPGDTLSGISVKVYNTSRHYQKIYEANKDAIEDPNTLQVGLKLTMPDLPAKSATANNNQGAPGTGTVPTNLKTPVAAPAGAKVVEVSPGDRLWNIAAKFA